MVIRQFKVVDINLERCVLSKHFFTLPKGVLTFSHHHLPLWHSYLTYQISLFCHW